MTEVLTGKDDAAPKAVPAWVGMALVAACVIAGALFIWWVVRDPLASGADFIPDPNGPVAGGRGPRVAFRPPPSPDTVRKVNETNKQATYLAQVGGVMMDVAVAKDGKANRYQFRYAPKNLLTAEQRDLMVMRFRVISDDATASVIGLSDDQKQKLQKVSTAYLMEMPQGDKDKLIGLFGTYLKASDDKARAGAEKDLLAALKTAGEKHLATSKKKATERIDQITSILTAEQVKKFKEMGNAAP